MNLPFDILGLGAVAVDELIYVAAYPMPNSKVRILGRDRQCGGLTATALVAAARLGCSCAYAGTVGTDEASDFALAAMAREGVCVEPAGRRAERAVHRSIILVDQSGRRTLLSDNRNVRSADDSWPEEGVIRRCKVLFVDHSSIADMIRPSRIARLAGIPVVADIERGQAPYTDELLPLIDHLIVPQHFAYAATGRDEPDRAAASLWTPGRQAVVVTCGENGSWFLGPDAIPIHYKAFRVPAVDTTGCGDVFHGAYAAGLIWRLDLAGRVRLASAAAAIKATRRGGQAGCPTRVEVEDFLAKNQGAMICTSRGSIPRR